MTSCTLSALRSVNDSVRQRYIGSNMNRGNQLLAKTEKCVTRNIAGETIIVPIRSNVSDLDSIYTLNEVGSVVWERIDGQTSVSIIIDAICKQFEVTENQVRKDVLELIDSLEAEGLIRLSGIAPY